MKIVMPLDPTGLSLNRWHGYHWAKKAKIKREWTEYSCLLAGAMRIKHGKLTSPAITLTCYFRTNHKRDADNFSVVAKVVLDGLTQGGLISDDNSTEIDLRPLVFYVDKINPRVEIELKEKNDRTN